MRTGFSIGHLLGINIRVDWSWIFVFLLVTWNLAAGFGQVHPEWGPVLNWALAAIAAILFFVSVLVHEMAHSLMAQAQGLPVRNITLFLFGGVSNIEREPPSPKAEFLITIVGPISSVVLGFLFLLAAGATTRGVGGAIADPQALLAGLGPLTTLLLWLGPINILLGIFNLVPGFPLDGGRILRSILWAATGNLRRATRWAAFVGQAVAWLMILTGIAMVFGVKIPFFGTGLIGGLWLAFIGWFLNTAAVQSYQQVLIHELLEDLPVARVMRTDLPAVPPNIPVSTLVHDYIMQTDEHGFPVMDEGELLGLVTLKDVRKVPREQWDQMLVREVMTPREELDSITPNEDASDAWRKLMRQDVQQVPVMQGRQLVGLVRRNEIARWLQLQADEIGG